MEIRSVTTQEEMAEVAANGEGFAKLANYKTYDPEYFTETWFRYIVAGIGQVFAAYTDEGDCVGAICLMKGPGVYEPTLSVYTVNWYVDPDYRGTDGLGQKLFRTSEEWAKDQGAKIFHSGCTIGPYKERLQKFLENDGFELFELHYVKRI